MVSWGGGLPNLLILKSCGRGYCAKARSYKSYSEMHYFFSTDKHRKNRISNDGQGRVYQNLAADL